MAFLAAAASSAAVLLALAAAEQAFAAAAEVWQQGFFPGPAAAAVEQLSVHLPAGQLESSGVALELVQLEFSGASVLHLEQELTSGALALEVLEVLVGPVVLPEKALVYLPVNEEALVALQEVLVVLEPWTSS